MRESIRRPPQTRLQREIAVRHPIQYTQQKVISHAPQQQQHVSQQAITSQRPHTRQQNALSPTIQTNMEIDYQSPALQQQQEHGALQYTQKPALQYSPPQVLQYSQQLQQALQPTSLQDTQSKMELDYNPPTSQHVLTHNHGVHQQMDFTQQRNIQPINYNQHIPIAQDNMQVEQYRSQPAEMEKYNPNIGKLPEIKQYICTLCHTPTRYDTYEKLEHHRERFHAAFDQTERGTKRKKHRDDDDDDKKLKTGNEMFGGGGKRDIEDNESEN